MIFIDIIINKQNAFIPTNDYVFKRIFGHVGNEEITKDFINSILDTEVKEINLEGNTILDKDIYDDKVSILDVKAVLDKNIICDIEMQLAHKKDIEKRILFYWSKLYSANIKSGAKYANLKRTIVILLANFELDILKDIPNFHTEWHLREKQFSNVVLTNFCEFHIIELSKLQKLIEKNFTYSNSKLITWVKFLLTPDELEDKDMENNKSVKQAKDELDYIKNDEREQELAFQRLIYLADKQAIEDYGFDKGLEEGIKQGIEQGEKNKQIEIAKEMLRNNVTIELIKKCTQLSESEIENLKKELI